MYNKLHFEFVLRPWGFYLLVVDLKEMSWSYWIISILKIIDLNQFNF